MKERLTGAIILVALIVLLVPELLTGPIKSAPRAVASSSEEPPLRSYTIDLAEDAHARGTAAQPQSAEPLSPSPAQAAGPEAPTGGATQAPAAPAATPVKTETPAPQSTPAAKPQAPAATPPAGSGAGEAGAWMVQLGSFASRANADHLARQLKGLGFSASVSQGSTGRHLYRVRVGPVHDRGAATQLQAKLKAAGHSGAVVPK